MFLEAIVSLLLVVGATLALIGAVGLVKFDDFFMRLHGPTKATTLGLGALLLAAWLERGAATGNFWPRELLITFFLFLTAPISAHILAKAALHRRLARRTPMPPEAGSATE